MGLLSTHETIVWREFQLGKNTSSIAEEHQAEAWTPAYVSRVLNRAREKIAKTLKEHANSHRLKDSKTLAHTTPHAIAIFDLRLLYGNLRPDT